MNLFSAAFIEETNEIFQHLEKDLVDLEKNSDNGELINDIFRNIHTLKGSGAMFGFDHLSSFAHELEALFDAIRNKRLIVTSAMVTLLLESCDYLKHLRDDPHDNDPDPEKEQTLIKSIRDLLPVAIEPSATIIAPSKGNTESPETGRFLFRICYEPGENIFTIGINPIILFNNLKALGECFIYCHDSKLPSIHEMNPEQCYISWTAICATDAPIDKLKDLFMFAEESGCVTILPLSEYRELENLSIPMIGEILLQKGDISREDLQKVLSNKIPFGEQAVSMGIASPDDITSALFEQQIIKNVQKSINSQAAARTLRVNNEKLDILTNTVSELVILQARLTQFSEDKKENELSAIAEYLEKLTASLRDTVMHIRTVAVQEGFSILYRLVRDLSQELEKKATITIIGGDTELDKTVIDNLKDPMVHLIRNCMDHGLETSEERTAQGKSATGQITIKAEHLGPQVLISISDDGRGLDPDQIRKKAIDKGLVAEKKSLTEKEIFSFIFHPGFSTKNIPTRLSGRGVGMDVVKKNIESIRGEVSIESKKNIGTTVHLKLPLSLAIIDGLLFTVGDELFILNIASVSECLELTPEIRCGTSERNILQLRDQVVPFIFLRDVFSIPGIPPEHQHIIIMHAKDDTLGLVVDSVQGKHQTVVKSTGRIYSPVREVTGATILGDGSVALILDPNILSQKVNQHHYMTHYQIT